MARGAVRAINCDGVGQASGVIAGLDWLLGQSELPRPAIVSMSLGVADVEDILNKAVSAVLQQGITVVTAAGNENSGILAYLQPSLDRHLLAPRWRQTTLTAVPLLASQDRKLTFS